MSTLECGAPACHVAAVTARTARFHRWALGCALLSSLGACRSLPELDWNPLLRVEHTPDGGVEIEALGPLINVRDGPDGFSHALRPLYQHKANAGLPVSDFLAPFGRRWAARDGTRWRFWPLVWAGETKHTEAGDSWGVVVFPIIFAGDGPAADDGYFAVFPLGGRIRNLFGIHTFDFALWPLFMRTHMEITEPSDSWTVLFIGGWTTGGPRDGSWRFLPFYRHRVVRSPEGELRTDQRTAPWPLITWGDDALDTDAPAWRFGFWPLVSHEGGPRWSKTTWLWPFFRVNRERNPSPSEGGEFLYDLPWPLFRWARDDDGGTFRVFPLYSRQTSRELDSTAFLIPLGWWRVSRGTTADLGFPTTPYQRSDLWFLPVWHSSRRQVEGRPEDDTQLQVWPLFHSDDDATGRRDAGFPSLVLARHWEFMRPVDELYSPFFTLWRHRVTAGSAAEETRLLFDTTFWRHSPEGVRVSIPFVYSRRPEPDGSSHHGLLWGLFGARTDAQGLAALSLAGIDLWER